MDLRTTNRTAKAACRHFPKADVRTAGFGKSIRSPTVENNDHSNASSVEQISARTANKEIEAMGLEIVSLMTQETDPDAQLAREHLNAVIHETLDR